MKKEIQKGYYYNGKIMYESPYVNGNRHGLVKWWHENGQLGYELSLKNDIHCGAKIYFKY